MLPQLAQYLLPSGFSKPQFGHLSTPNRAADGTFRLWPQLPQNFWPSVLSAPQLGHFMRFSNSVSQLTRMVFSEAGVRLVF